MGLTSVLAEERDPKLLFVSSSTSTTMATATSTASGTFTCYILSKTDFKACTGRRKKRAISLIEDGGLPVDLETPEITISKVQRSLPSAEIDSGNVDPIEANREAKFAWYYDHNDHLIFHIHFDLNLLYNYDVDFAEFVYTHIFRGMWIISRLAGT